MNTDTFDYIVVGAGSAGAAAAARLSESGKYSVVLLDAGPPDRNLWTRIPLGVSKIVSQGIYLRHFFTEPDPNMDGRKIYWPRGWVVGGSSTVNGMIWVHGTPHIFDEWAADGCPGWGYADLLPWFKKIESFSGGSNDYRGRSGPVSVSQFKPVDPLPDAFLDSLDQSGVGRRVEDFNARGIGGSHNQYNLRNGVRCNTRMAYLDPAQGRANLTVMTETLAQRVLLDSSTDKPRATGILASSAGRDITLHARREVILCGGAFNSPQLLELSGIGRREVLSAAEVPMMHEMPMVGENLSEHVYSPIAYRTTPEVSWNSKLSSPIGQAALTLRWLTTRSGPMSSNSITAQAFVPLAGEDPDKAEVKLQIQQVSTPGNRGKTKLALDSFPGATLASFQIRPHSRGSCHISSRDPSADPRMISNHFSDPRDVDACLRALKMSRQLASTPALSRYLLEETRPGSRAASDESLVAHLRATGATAYHPLGTCRIGADASTSVVDPQLRVHGVQNLRVADGSVCPSIAATNTNAICIVIGERVASMCLEEKA